MGQHVGNPLESTRFGTVVSRIGSWCDQGSSRAIPGEDAPSIGNPTGFQVVPRHTFNPQLEALGCIPAVGKGSKSSLEEDMSMDSLPESPDNTGKAEVMPLVGTMSAVESQDLHTRRGLPCLRSQHSCCSIRAVSAQIWRALHS